MHRKPYPATDGKIRWLSPDVNGLGETFSKPLGVGDDAGGDRMSNYEKLALILSTLEIIVMIIK